jgi:hypothetical protein
MDESEYQKTRNEQKIAILIRIILLSPKIYYFFKIPEKRP